MVVLSLKNKYEREKGIELCKNLLEKHALIPVVGAGFSVDTQTDNHGSIPSVSDLHNKLYDYIECYSGYEAQDLLEVKEYNLSNIAQVFWSIYDRMPDEGLTSFFEYIAMNFQSVSFRKDFQESFLSVRWPYLFTLNYDSLIEDSSREYYPIIPFNKINRHYYAEKTKLYKLHGDAKRFLDTGDKKYLILSRDQYVESLMDNDNSNMLSELLSSFSSKSILFYGCGLTEELDILYSSQLAIKEKVRNIDPDHQAIIYISFETDNDGKTPFSTRKQDQLSQYGVTHILRVFSNQQSKDFFSELAKITSTIQQPGIDSILEKYSSIRYDILSPDDKRCRDYLFQESLIWKSFDDHVVTLPGYYVTRSEVSKVVDSISTGNPLCFVSGNFFSGKTYFLLEIAHHFTSRKVYIFPSGIKLTPAQLDRLLGKRNTILCFDAKSLTTEQIKIISSEESLDIISRNNSSAVVVIDTSDAPMYKYIFEARNHVRKFQQINVHAVLDEQEGFEFNKKIGMISLPPYSNGDTLLDYIVHNEVELVGDSLLENYFLEPQKELLALNTTKRVKALIMLATEIRITAKRAILFGIDSAINDMIKCCRHDNRGSVIERDYSIFAGDSSGYEFVCNSKYWIIRALSVFANNQRDSVSVICNSYYSIIEDYRRIYKDNSVKFYQNSGPYYFFNHIQILFNQRWFPNSSRLMNQIYDKLLPLLSDSYQFLHQKAKGILIVAQVQIKKKHNRNAIENLKEALININRAIQLAECFPEAKNIEETILHMKYTKGRILIEYSCVSVNRVPQAVDACYKLYQMQETIRDDAYDFVKSAGSDRRSFIRFKAILMKNQKIRHLKGFDKKKAEYLLSRWTGSKVTYKKA